MEQQLYETEVVLKVTLKHWQTCSPEKIVENARKCLTQHAMTVSCEQVGELQTTPEWHWRKK